MKIYQVGGAVRDRLLGIEPNDIDYVVVGSTADEMKSLGFVEVGKGFPVFLHSESKDEYALARKEIKTGEKHTDFEFIFNKTITLHEDLERRDFTCNAIALDMQTGEYIDYFGGKRDIDHRVLRHINSAHFMEDPLRVLRLCRFAAQLNFKAAPETLELCKQMVGDGMMKFLTCERVWTEILKALKAPQFYKFVELALETGALKAILPEVQKMWETDEYVAYHPEGTTGGHVLNALKYAKESSALVKFGILMHDIGKTLTPKNEWPSHKGHENRAENLIFKICRRLKVPHKFRNFACLAAQQHMKFHYIPQMRIGSLYELAEAMTIRHQCYVDEYIEVCRADFLSTNMNDKENAYLEFQKSAKMLKFACEVLAKIKATDMPKFAQLPKDESFNLHFREYKIKVLHEKITNAFNI